MFSKKLFRDLDLPIIIIISLLFIVGMISITSATKTAGNFTFVKQQAIWFITGIVIMLVITSIDYNALGNLSPYLMLIGILSLIAVLIPGIGVVRGGARCWFQLPGDFLLQPAEFVKIFFILNFGRYIAKIREKDDKGINKPMVLAILLAYCCIPIVLLIRQPDYGMALVFIAIIAIMLFMGNLSIKYIMSFLGLILLSLAPFFYFILPRMEEHVQKRIMSFINPTADPLGAGYHAAKSQLAIGSGRILGQGVFKGMQTQMVKGGLPVKESDFIFAVIGEEFGFIGASIVLILFVLLIIRCIYIAKNARDTYGMLIVMGATAMLGFQFVQNVGMTIGLMPITGITLPFVSYGGSSMWTNMATIGLIQSVAVRRKNLKF